MPHFAMDNLTSVDDLSALLEGSDETPLVIFKHSLSCPISRGAHAEMTRHMEEAPVRGVTYRIVVVQQARAVSEAIAARLGVRHESPQAIVVRGGAAAWTASHWDVTDRALRAALAGAAAPHEAA